MKFPISFLNKAGLSPEKSGGTQTRPRTGILNRSSRFIWVWVFLSSFFFSGCINIEEYYHFNRDGSGSMWIKMDVKDMMAMMGGFMEEMKEEEGADDLDTDDLFDNSSTIDQLKSISGITNVKSLSDKDEMIIGYSFDFDNLTALNNSLGLVDEEVSALTDQSGGSDGGGNKKKEHRNFKYSGKKLIVSVPKVEPDEDEEDNELDKSMMEMMVEMMKEYSYKTTYSFEQKIKKASNKSMEIAPDNKSIVVEKSMADLMTEKVDMSGTIKLKK